MRKIFCIILFVLFFVQAGLFAEPAWIKNPYSEHPRDAYLCGVGFGVNQSDADIAAKTEIAGFFGTAIDSESEVYSYSAESQGSVYYADSMETKSIQRISENEIAGMEIAARYSDSNGFYALAVLNKRNSSLYYEAKILALQSELVSLKNSILSRGSDLAKMYDYAAYRDKYELYSKYIKIVTALMQSVPVYLNPGIADPMILERDVFDNMAFSVSVSGDANGEIEAAIKTVLTDMGFAVTRSSSRYALNAIVRMEEVVLGSNPNKFVNYGISIALSDRGTGRTYYSFNKGGREGQRTMNVARSKTIYDIVKIVKEDFARDFRKNLFN